MTTRRADPAFDLEYRDGTTKGTKLAKYLRVELHSEALIGSGHREPPGTSAKAAGFDHSRSARSGLLHP